MSVLLGGPVDRLQMLDKSLNFLLREIEVGPVFAYGLLKIALGYRELSI